MWLKAIRISRDMHTEEEEEVSEESSQDEGDNVFHDTK